MKQKTPKAWKANSGLWWLTRLLRYMFMVLERLEHCPCPAEWPPFPHFGCGRLSSGLIPHSLFVYNKLPLIQRLPAFCFMDKRKTNAYRRLHRCEVGPTTVGKTDKTPALLGLPIQWQNHSFSPQRRPSSGFLATLV